MQSVNAEEINKLLRDYTEELPKRINPPDEEKLLLLVEPVNFRSLILFSPGVSIFKAIYGRGKTYGIGYYTVHYCEREKTCSAIYINVRRMHSIISSLIQGEANIKSSKNYQDILSLIMRSGTTRLDLELLYTILSILDPNSRDIFGIGDVLVTSDLSNVDRQIIEKIKSDVMQAEDSQKLSRLFESLVENLIFKSHISPKFILILDEFEQIIPNWFNQLQTLRNLLITLLDSLRSNKGGVLEKYPNSFVLVLTIQELAYPSEAMREFRKSAAPVLGKIVSTQDDLSIYIKFSPYDENSIREYYEKAINLLVEKGYVTKEEGEGLKQISKCISYYFSPLLKMPARLFFDRLRWAIAQVVSIKGIIMEKVKTSDDRSICNSLENELEDIKSKIAESGIYGLYVSKEVSGINKDKMFAMLRKLAEELEGTEISYISEVKANGYEGIVVPHIGPKKSANIILYKGRSVKLGEIKYKQGFLKHYERALVEYCGYAKGEKDEVCKIIVVHPEEVNVIGMLEIIQEIQQIGSTRINKKVIDVPLDRDELAALYIKSPATDSTDQLSFIAGDMEYYEQRFKEVIERIKRQIEKEVSRK